MMPGLRLAASAGLAVAACSSPDTVIVEPCGPNRPCASGFTCEADGGSCVKTGTVMGADAGLTQCTKTGNRALSFAGGQVVTVPDSRFVLRLDDLTLEAWARFAGLPGQFQVIVTKPLGSATADSYVIWTEAGRINGGVNPTNPGDAIGTGFTPTLGTWYHFVLTFDHTTRTQKLYVDGALVATGTTAAVVQYDDHPVLIGGDINFGALSGFFDGDIDEVKIWTSVRDADQVGLDLHSCTPGSFTGLAARRGRRADDGRRQRQRQRRRAGHDHRRRGVGSGLDRFDGAILTGAT